MWISIHNQIKRKKKVCSILPTCLPSCRMLSKFPWEKDIPWSSNDLDNYMPRLDDRRFQQKLRMSPTTFKHVLEWFEDMIF
jgi:hypothetical protein